MWDKELALDEGRETVGAAGGGHTIEKLREASLTPYTRLWRAVVAWNATEAVRGVKGGVCGKTQQQRRKNAARIQAAALDWILSPDYAHDFEMVCALADLDPDTIRDRIRQISAGKI